MLRLSIGMFGILCLVTGTIWVATAKQTAPGKATPDDLCHRLKSGNASQLKGVSVTKQHLYLVEGEMVHRVPLHDRYVNWNKRKVALFDRGTRLEPPEQRFDVIGRWNAIPRIAQALSANAIRWQHFKLLRLAIFGDSSQRLWMDACYERSGEDVQSPLTECLLVSSELVGPQGDSKVMRQQGSGQSMNVVADHKMERVLVFSKDAHGWILTESVQDLRRTSFHIELLVQQLNYRMAIFHESMPLVPLTPLFTSLPIFGFIVDRMAQLWDVQQREVHLLNLGHNLTYPKALTTVSFDEYFACSEEDWGIDEKAPEKLEPPEELRMAPQRNRKAQREKALTVPRKDGMTELGSIAWLILLTVLLLFLLAYFQPANDPPGRMRATAFE